MYLDHFSLERPPFRITPDPSLFFPGGEHGRGVVLEALIYGITTGEGILKVVGEVGSGKTMLCRMLEEKLPKNIEIVYLANPSLSARDIVYAIAFELNLDVEATTDRLVVMQNLQDYLLKKHADGGSVVVFIEEAQSMPLDALEEVRLLSNLETHHHKLMQIVLFGQPELDKKLQTKSIRQLKERITHNFNLDPLSVDATREYLHFRLQAAGCPKAHLFSPKAEKLLAKTAAGLTRRVNILADKSLLAAYADSTMRPGARNAQGESLSMVLPRHVKAAIKDSDYKERFVWLKYAALSLVSIGFVVLLGIIGRNLLQLNSPTESSNVISEVLQALQLGEENTVQVSQRQQAIDNEEVLAEAGTLLSESQAVDENGQGEQPATIEQEFTSVSMPENDNIRDVVDTQESSELMSSADVRESEAEYGAEPMDIQSVGMEMNQSLELEEPVFDTITLLEQRTSAATQWLRNLPEIGYTVQLFTVSQTREELIESFLDYLKDNSNIDQVYVCWLSANEGETPAWIVLYGEFQGVSKAREFISRQPDYIQQYAPYVRNLNEVSCLNGS